MKRSIESLNKIYTFPEGFDYYKKLSKQEMKTLDHIKPSKQLPAELEYLKLELELKKGKYDVEDIKSEFNTLNIDDQKQFVLTFLKDLFPSFKFQYFKELELIDFDQIWSFYMQTFVNEVQIDAQIFLGFLSEYENILTNGIAYSSISKISHIDLYYSSSFEGNKDNWIHCH